MVCHFCAVGPGLILSPPDGPGSGVAIDLQRNLVGGGRCSGHNEGRFLPKRNGDVFFGMGAGTAVCDSVEGGVWVNKGG